jgi:hypothetical protein
MVKKMPKVPKIKASYLFLIIKTTERSESITLGILDILGTLGISNSYKKIL